MKGLFITFEGPEGGGKSTQVARLAKRLRMMGRRVVVTREPGGTPAGEAIRDVLQHDARGEKMSAETETLLFIASRAQLVRSVIDPALKKGSIVLCDRFSDSTIAYQGYGRGMNIEALARLNSFAVGTAVPGLTILLDLDVRTGFRRLESRNRKRNTGHDRIEREAVAFHRKVRNGYLDMAAREPRRYMLVDADRSVDEVDQAIWKIVCRRIKPSC